MTAIWLLSTRGRPKEAQETIDACMDAGMTSRGVVYVDETVRMYRNLKLPKNWTAHPEPKWRSLQGSMSWCFETYPDATQYGWLADDTRPRTRGWDKRLERLAGDWRLVYCRDLWMSENAGMREQLRNGRDLSSGLCWGGNLVRTVGWWALPGVKQAGIDTAWTEIVRPFNLHRYAHSITVEHLNWRTKKRKYDDVDSWERDGDNYIERDLEIRDKWVASSDYRNTMRRVGVAVGDTETMRATMRYAMRESYANERWQEKRSLPGVRLKQIMEGDFDDAIERIDGFDPDTDQRPAGLDRPLRPVGAGANTHGLGDDRL